MNETAKEQFEIDAVLLEAASKIASKVHHSYYISFHVSTMNGCRSLVEGSWKDDEELADLMGLAIMHSTISGAIQLKRELQVKESVPAIAEELLQAGLESVDDMYNDYRNKVIAYSRREPK